MIAMLFISWQALEWKIDDRSNFERSLVDVTDDLNEIIPITDLINPPLPPPPPPAISAVVILEIEDETEVEESVIESTETNQKEQILEVQEIEEEVKEEEVIADVPFLVIENVPIFPGCENEANNAAKKECMSEKAKEFVKNTFNTDLANDLELEGQQRIFVTFKIDKNGDVVNVRARVPQPKLEEEAVKVVKSLPHMTHGKQRGVPVGVLYGLPIIFQVEI